MGDFLADPFGILLSSAVSWGIGKILDALLDCFRCGYDHTRDIQNRQVNYFSCPSCYNSIDQYVNACDYTFNRNSRRVGVAGISSTWWKGWGGVFNPDFEPHCSVWTLDLKGRDQVIRLELGELGLGTFFHQDVALSTSYRHSIWRDIKFRVPSNIFPRHGCTVTVDFKVLSDYNDLLATRRRLMALHSPPVF